MNTQLVLHNPEEKTMTTKEIATQLQVSTDLIQRACKKIFPKKMIKGKKTLFNEVEVTELINEIKNNKTTLERTSAVSAEVIKNASTRLTPALKLKQAFDLAQEAYKEELERIKAENKSLEIKNESLQIELDVSKEWYSVKRMEKLNPDKKFDWRLLKSESEKRNIEIKKVFDQNYGEVNAYHVSIWESLYFDTLNFKEKS